MDGTAKDSSSVSQDTCNAGFANAEFNTVGCVLGSKQIGYNHCGAAALFLLDSSVAATKGAADSQPNKFKLY